MKEINSLKKIELSPVTYTDERGWVVNPFEAITLPKESVSFFHVVNTKSGHIRGNHYHTNTTEWLLICGGTSHVAWRPVDSKESHTYEITTPAMFEIPPNIAHAILNTGDNDNLLISFCDSPERDTVRCDSLFDR